MCTKNTFSVVLYHRGKCRKRQKNILKLQSGLEYITHPAFDASQWEKHLMKQ